MNITVTLTGLADALLARSRQYGFIPDTEVSGAMIRGHRQDDGAIQYEWVGPENGLVPIAYCLEAMMPELPWPMELVARDDAQEIAWYRRVAPQGTAS
jgi:hypothetical protein